MNDDFVENLIKQGKYQDVLKYLEDKNNLENKESNYNNKIENDNFHEYENLGLDKNLIMQLQSNNLEKSEIMEEDDYNLKYNKSNLQIMNIKFDPNEFLNQSQLSNNNLPTDNNDMSYLNSVQNDMEKINDNLFSERENIFEQFLFKNIEKENKNDDNDLIKNSENVSDQIQNLLKRNQENTNKMIQLDELENMRKEEINAIILQEQKNQILFPYKDMKLPNFSKIIYESKEFSKSFSYSVVKFVLNKEKYINNNSDNILKDFDKNFNLKIEINEIVIIEEKNIEEINKIHKITKSTIITPQNKFYINNFQNLLKNVKNEKIIDKLKPNYNFTPNQINKNTKNECLKINISLNNNNIQIKNEETTIISEKISNWNKNFNFNNNNETPKKEFTNLNFQNFNNIFINLYNISSSRNNLNTLDKNSTNSQIYEIINNSKNIPSNIKLNLSNIFELNLNAKKIKNLPQEIFLQLTNIQYLNLEENNITKIENLQNCINLTSLNLNKNSISLIENLDKNINLERLSLNGNNIQKIENLDKNIKLKNLSLGRNKINSIEEIEIQIPFIEELTLCENQIKNIPKDLSMPFLRYIDLNDNKINSINFLFCPNLEKIFLRDNKIRLINSLKFCNKLKEIDISFNKIDFFADVLSLLKFNRNLEVINLTNNPFSMEFKSLFNFNLSMKKIFPILKTIDNESITFNNLVENKNNKLTNYNLSCFSSYFNILNNETNFLKYFNAVYHSNNIFEKFNFNTGKKDLETYKLMNCFNDNYYFYKNAHFNNLENLVKNNYIHITKNVNMQYDFLKYIYKFKHKFEYLLNSFLIMKSNFFKRKVRKILKIQKNYKGYIYRKRFKENLKKLAFEDDEYGNDDILNFFKNDNNLDLKEYEVENKIIELKIEKETKNNFYNNLEVIQENENEQENTIISDNKSFSILMNDKILNEEVKIKPELNKNEIENKIKILEYKLKHNENHMKDNSNNKIKINSLKNSLQKHTNLNTRKQNNYDMFNIVNVMDNTNFPEIKKENEKVNFKLNNVNNILPILNKNHILLNENKNSQKNITNEYNTGDIQLPIIPTSNSLHSSHENLSVSIKNYSQSRTSSNRANNSVYKGSRLLPTKIIEEIKLIEEECRISIKNAKEEWKFHNPHTLELLSNKIKKTYKKRIDKILQNF